MGKIVKLERPNQLTRFSPPVLDDKLRDLLGRYRGLSDAPIVGPKTAAALQAFVDAPAVPPMPTQNDVEQMLMLLATVKARRKTADAEADALHELYWQGLKDIPLDDLRHAYDVLLKSSPWFPDISEIRKAADGGPVKRYRMRKVIAKSLIAKHEQEWMPPCEPITPEQIAQVKAILGDAA